MSNNTILSSSALCEILSTLAFNDAEAATRLLQAQGALRSATRRAIQSGDTRAREEAQTEVDLARAHRAEAASMLTEGVRMHDEAVAREAAEAREAARGKLRDLTAQMLAAAREADTALAIYAGHLMEARRLELEASALSQSALSAPVPGSIVSEALSDGSRHLLAMRGETPDPIRGFAEERTRKSVRRLSLAAGL